MNRKLKFLLLKFLLLLFLIPPLFIEAILFLGTTVHLNFETTMNGSSITPKFHVTSLVPTLTDIAVSLPNVTKVTISQVGHKNNYYSLNFELEGINPQPPAVPTDKETYEEIEKLLEEITNALQNNKVASYEILSGKKFFSNIFRTWSLITLTIIFIILFLFIKLTKIEKRSTESIFPKN
ncbi:MAG: hypothetical protein J6T23_04965 [Elusimicrobia bacterium]|nr:hypothetical protein [Elusimicrobiota bacterium]